MESLLSNDEAIRRKGDGLVKNCTAGFRKDGRDMADPMSVEILRTELSKEAPDREVVVQFLKTLKESEEEDTRASPVEDGPQVEKAWTRFRGNRNKPWPAEKKRPAAKLGLQLAAALTILCVILCAVQPALGAKSLCELIGQWTEEFFSFFQTEAGPATPQPRTVLVEHPGLQEVRDTLLQLGITQPVVPTWLPDGYQLKEIKVFEVNTGLRVHAIFASAYGCVTLSIRDGYTIGSVKHSKDIADAEVVELHGVIHYIISNETEKKAVWIAEGMECFLTVNGGDEDMIKILRSIYGEVS